MKVGDWVEIKLATNLIYGYIDYIPKQGSQVHIRKVYAIDGDGKKRVYLPKYNFSTYESSKLVVLEKVLNEEDISDLINLALDTHDEEWFMELVKKRGEQIEKVY